ncbi:cytadherence high molecular weight protein 1-like isoform X6 [Paralichthys olivaceus]|uniref:cytadherence high molecular weight protein 1-like isoform X6 n=1 Tax=Paralichthys olivaceus TaxID=8255 RepID=UPI003751EFB1
MGLVFSWLLGQKQVAHPLLDVTTDSQVTPTAEAPEATPAEAELQSVEATVVTTETIQTHDVCETEIEAEALAEEEAVEVAVTEETTSLEPVVEATEEPVVEAQPEAVEEITEMPEQMTEAVVSPAAEEDKAEVEVLAEEDAPEELAEPVTLAEDVPASTEIPTVPASMPEALVEETLVAEVKEAPVDTLVDDFVVTNSAIEVEVAIAESVAAQEIQSVDATPAPTETEQEVVALIETPCALAEPMDMAPAEVELQPELKPEVDLKPEPVLEVELAAAPALEMIIDALAEQKCLDVLSEELKSEACDMPCQMQLTVDSMQLNSAAEMSVETALNGHIVPEVSIEG